MSNEHVFNTLNNNVFSLITNPITNPVIATGPPYSASLTGNVFSAFTINSQSLGLLGGSVITSVRLNNTSPTKTCYIIRVAGGVGVGLSLLSSLSATFSMFKNGTQTSPAALTPQNSNLGSSNTSAMTVTSSTGAITGGTTILTMPVNAGPFVTDMFGSIVVPPSSVLSMSLSGSLSVAGTLACQTSIFWWEA